MAKALIRIPFEEFATNPAGVFDRVVANRETIVVEKDNGSAAVLRPAPKRRRRSRTISDADWQAFLSSAGGWSDVDTDKLVKDIYESRNLSPRRQVEL
jgi:hypothetical protein